MIKPESISIFFLTIIILIISYAIANSLLPVIINIVSVKKIMDEPNERSSHIKKTPTLGGVSFFASIMISLFFIKDFDTSQISFSLIGALTLLFFTGLKDDLTVLSSGAKIRIQTFAILLVLLNSEIRISTFHGFLGIYQIPFWFSLVLSYIIVLYIINAYNLIDGIDGLAGLLGILIASIFALFFYFSGLFFYMLIAIIIVGFLISFLRFNLSRDKKIFMGDTGSMIVGFLLGFLTLRFLSLNNTQIESINILPENLFIISLSILFFPVIDVIRVVFVRILSKQKPFKADRRHLHHIFIDKGLQHIKASLTITASNIFIFLLIFILNQFFSFTGLLVVFIFITVLTFYALLLLGTDNFSKNQRKRIKWFIPNKIYFIEYKIRKLIILSLKSMFYKELL